MQSQYPQGFFDLQIIFAQRIAQLLQQPYQETLRTHTALYRIFGLDWSLNPMHSRWQEYVQRLPSEYNTQQVSNWTYLFYLKNFEGLPKWETPRWGCFSYEYLEEQQIIYLHFGNLDFSGYGPLSHQRKEARIADLRSMFTHIKHVHPQARNVQGHSWLYNREAYKRLFPPAYVQSARPGRQGLIGRGLWGQFLRHGEQLNEELAARFLERVAQLEDAVNYTQCFPYLLLQTEAPIAEFYEF